MTEARVIIDVHPDATEVIAAAAVAAHPQETGGLLLGWWDAGHVVVRHAVEVPDLGATTNSWSRDEPQAQAALNAALDEHRHPWLGYVGDWHSHPAPCGASSQDVTSIRRASRQYTQPLVLLVHRADGAFDHVVAHRGRTRRTTTPLRSTKGSVAPMTQPKPAAGPPSASGVRRGGDSFQDLFVWGGAMRVIGPRSPFAQLKVESKDAAHVDDLVLRLTAPDAASVYTQVKWATNTAFLLDETYLLARKKNGRSVLEKLYASYRELSANGSAPHLRLVTNRPLDSTHPLLGHVDGRTDLLMPYAGQASTTSAAGKVVDAWADHVEADRDDLLEMLEHLQFHPGRAVTAEREHVRALMVAAGLDDNNTALQHGLNTVAEWVEGGKRVVTAKDIHEAVDQLGLRRVEPSAILVVQAIDTDPHADEATVALDWVDLFDGDQPRVRVEPRDPSGWQRMEHELTEAAATLESQGWTSTLVRGAMRQATFFRVGTALPAVRQHTLRYLQGGQLWSTDAPKTPVAAPQVQRTPLGLGSDLAVAVGVAVDPRTAVAEYLRSETIPVGELVTIQPAAGADDQAVTGAGQAVAYAQQIRDLVRQELDRQPAAECIHLFLAGPGGLALLLGHRWNRTRKTVVYEHLGAGRGYTPAFTVDA